MRRVFNAVVAVAVVAAFGSLVFAQSPATSEKKPAEKTAVKTVKKSNALAANGTVAKFDETTKTLTLTTKEGEKEFTLAANAKIMSGASTVPTAELSGKHVKVTYVHENGKNVASKVTIAATHPTGTSGKK